MASKRRIILHVLAYTLYGLVVCLALLYVAFPYDLLRQWVIERFSQGDLQLAIARVRPGFPPGVHLHNIRLLANQAGLPGALVQVETLRVHPALLDLFSSMLHVRLDATLYSGTLQGDVRSAVANGTTPWQLQANFADLQIERHPLVQKDDKAFLRGRLGGDLSATLDSDGFVQQGTLNLHLQSVVFIGNQGLQLPLPREIICNTVDGHILITPRQWQINSLVCRSNDLDIRARGVVRWQSPLTASVLELQVQMRSVTAYKQEIDLIGSLVQRLPDRRGVLSFNIRGTLQQLRFGV